MRKCRGPETQKKRYYIVSFWHGNCIYIGMIKNEIENNQINPIHGTRDADKLEQLVISMRESGWQGRPILAIDEGEGIYQAITGSHRIAAAREAGINISCLIIEDKDIVEDYPGAWCDEWAMANDDDDRKQVLHDFGLNKAAELMAEEIAANEAEWK